MRLASIHEAVRYGDVLELQAMVQRGAGINALDNKFKFTPLHWSALHGTLEVKRISFVYSYIKNCCNLCIFIL